MIINITSSYDQETNVTKITETKGILIDVQETPLSSISSKFFIQDDSEREMFYNYDPRKGIHIATFLGSFLILILCFIIYKDKKKVILCFKRSIMNDNYNLSYLEKCKQNCKCCDSCLDRKPRSNNVYGMRKTDSRIKLYSQMLKHNRQEQVAEFPDAIKFYNNQTYNYIMKAGLGAAIVPMYSSFTPLNATDNYKLLLLLTDSNYSSIYYPGHNSLKSDDEE
ncbi:uncharacterized protein LOC135931101 isoform X2 [Gordionus sp. m RMFG-2023]|uniref:uncharacterized protein LOC135931101 isoform X2 n=1 Tax=Gordionus sp. m RMFG-2023 TaxID=3053472 RepID=UPI0031FCFA36